MKTYARSLSPPLEYRRLKYNLDVAINNSIHQLTNIDKDVLPMLIVNFVSSLSHANPIDNTSKQTLKVSGPTISHKSATLRRKPLWPLGSIQNPDHLLTITLLLKEMEID